MMLSPSPSNTYPLSCIWSLQLVRIHICHYLRLRARGQLTELRAADLWFTSSETAEFLNQVMGLGLSTEDIAALETRTEGWIAGLQLAALALQGTLALQRTITLQGHADISRLIQSFTGSHRFVLDYLNIRQAIIIIEPYLDKLKVTGEKCENP
jgi:ATP/maltotriose-dependent transcriptional regulator MalT